MSKATRLSVIVGGGGASTGNINSFGNSNSSNIETISPTIRKVNTNSELVDYASHSEDENEITKPLFNDTMFNETSHIMGAAINVEQFLDPETEKLKSYDRRNLFQKLLDFTLRRKKYFGRTIFLNGQTVPKGKKYPANVVRNRRYNFITFLPLVLFEQFKFFFNLYFLVVALSQIIPQLQVGFLFTYVAPLAFVLCVTLLKEAYDDIKRWRRDIESNSQKFLRLSKNSTFETVPSSKIKVGDIIQIETDQRIPADCILLRTTEKSGASFIRTDQLDGETDQKLRHAIPTTQKLTSDFDLKRITACVFAEKPKKEIYDFIGNFTLYSPDGRVEVVEPLSLENTLWANTVVATGTVTALVIYTGTETRSALNASEPRSKVGKLDRELNTLSKFLFCLMFVVSVLMVALKQFQGLWYITIFRFVLLFSSIIPISLRVNLDMGKTVYSFFIMKDKKIPGTIVRNSSIPEELGRINYLFSDKTGTLTQNVMIFKKLHLGNISFDEDALTDIFEHVEKTYRRQGVSNNDLQVKEFIEALALCHNVTPIDPTSTHHHHEESMYQDEEGTVVQTDIQLNATEREYQGSSPDEIALVKFAEKSGLILESRSLNSMALKNPLGEIEEFEVLNIFPFTSASKRMGIVVKFLSSGKIVFYCKGADSVMKQLVKASQSEWLDEEADNMAREGLRTLVFGSKALTDEQYIQFNSEYKKASALINDRASEMERVRQKYLECDMNLLGVTGVEDKLQENVQRSLEQLRHAGVKVWMLTGDKVETAICISRSTKLVARGQYIFEVISNDEKRIEELLEEYEAEYASSGAGFLIDGATLHIALEKLPNKFVAAACKATSVVCCRCSPTQKAEVVSLVKKKTKSQTAAIGDGGNDVSMILCADVGIGIEGKEGKHASLAADFSIKQFSYCTDLILWHGRNSYKRSAALGQFIIHRGLIISVIQAIFSAMFFFSTIPIFTGWLLVGYATYYTNFPVFSLVLDEDVKRETVYLFPELYKELQKGRVLSFKTFLIWTLKAVYQGGVIMILAIFLFENNFLRIQSISFTALILTEIVMVSIEVHRKLNPLIIISEILSIAIYFASIFLLPTYFDTAFIMTFDFWWKSIVITAAATVVIIVAKFVHSKINPPVWSKLNESF
ncbi:hypothetical protein C9374_004224 [Naegleria lovaniensis]|uniref:Phospholipid-transporting ATPase n=1 Tax=Naegleria lovaniensis TaxID=51637 RepID=A0AA88KKX1_NAELO|nr:uncharacterized protein C9374_004224 [Naegleria lovaniensis]KAG2383553.1 hypothetical protein C9374_004224 [Naegleria lovaniensis]